MDLVRLRPPRFGRTTFLPAITRPKTFSGERESSNPATRKRLGEDAEQIADALKEAKIVAVRGHGTFALAETLHECLYLTHLLETSCRVSFMRSSVLGVKAAMR